MSNYVPYGDFPSGTSSSIEAAPPQPSSSPDKNGEASWKKNYVAYEEEGGGSRDEVDSNKRKE